MQANEQVKHMPAELVFQIAQYARDEYMFGFFTCCKQVNKLMQSQHEQVFKKRCTKIYFGHKDLNYCKLFFKQQFDYLKSDHMLQSFSNKQNECKIATLGDTGMSNRFLLTRLDAQYQFASLCGYVGRLTTLHIQMEHVKKNRTIKNVPFEFEYVRCINWITFCSGIIPYLCKQINIWIGTPKMLIWVFSCLMVPKHSVVCKHWYH